VQGDQIIEQIDAAVHERLLRFAACIGVRRRNVRAAVFNVASPDTERVVVQLAAHFCAQEIALHARREHFLTIRFRLEQRAFRQAIPTVDASLARSVFGIQLLADAEARFLLANVDARIERLGHVRELGQVAERLIRS
jgi:hypothetical protein